MTVHFETVSARRFLHVVRPIASLFRMSPFQVASRTALQPRPTEIVSLPLIAAMGLKKCQLFWCFNPQRSPVLETFTHADNRANDDSIVCTYNDMCTNDWSTFRASVEIESDSLSWNSRCQSHQRQSHIDGFELFNCVGSGLSMSHEKVSVNSSSRYLGSRQAFFRQPERLRETGRSEIHRQMLTATGTASRPASSHSRLPACLA